jgi:hypothetical protein
MGVVLMVTGGALLRELRQAGLSFAGDGDRLLAGPPDRLSTGTRETIRQHKRELLAALLLERLRDTYEERAAIAEYDGEQPRPGAERLAFETVLAMWLNDPASLPPLAPAGACPACGRPLGDDAVPVLRPGAGHLLIHDRCTVAWLQQRKAAGAAALVGAGIPKPTAWKPMTIRAEDDD